MSATHHMLRFSKGSDAHLEWLTERNALLVEANSIDSSAEEERYNTTCDALSAIEIQILETPATTRDDLLAQCLLAVVVTTEGGQITEEHASAIMANAKELLS